jgi:hypothetical protein
MFHCLNKQELHGNVVSTVISQLRANSPLFFQIKVIYFIHGQNLWVLRRLELINETIFVLFMKINHFHPTETMDPANGPVSPPEPAIATPPMMDSEGPMSPITPERM